MSETVEYLVLAVVVLLILLLACRSKKLDVEAFGMNEKPFEPDNSEVGRNPFDDIDYIRPKFIM